MKRGSKYSPEILLQMLRKAAEFRNEMVALGFTDNAGAIHSVERILDLLAYRLKYPGLTHVSKIRKYDGAEFSDAAWEAYKNGETVLVEHVAPQRAFAKMVLDKIADGKSDRYLMQFIKRKYQLALLTKSEAATLNRRNRSKIEADRLTRAGLVVSPRTQH
mgnify:CR=1 FL=1